MFSTLFKPNKVQKNFFFLKDIKLMLFFCIFYLIFSFIISFNILHIKILKIKPKNFFKCFNNDNFNLNFSYPNNCINYNYFTENLPCHLGISPLNNDEFILILGSSGKIGLSLVQELKKSNIKFIQIKSKLQFDLNNTNTYILLKKFKISLIIDLLPFNSLIHSKINDFSKELNIKIIRLVEKFQKFPNNIIQIKISKVFGREFLYLNNNYKKIYNYLLNKIDFNINDSNLYISSIDLSKKLIELINQILFFNINKQRFSINLPKFSLKDFKKSIFNFHLQKYDLIPNSFKLIISDILLNFFKLKYPYTTISFALTCDINRTEQLNQILNLYNNIFNLFPDISLKLKILLIENYNFSQCKLIHQINSDKIDIIIIPYNKYKNIQDYFNITSFPEYFFRNLNFQNDKSKYFFTSSSDIIPSSSFFKIIQKKLFTKFMIIKPSRSKILFNNSQEYIQNYFKESPNKQFFDLLDDPITIRNVLFNRHSGNLGDMQGGSQFVLKFINGWINNEYTYFIDTIFHIDFFSFPFPPYTNWFFDFYHFDHLSNRKNSPNFPIFSNKFLKNQICLGKRITKIFQNNFLIFPLLKSDNF